MDANSYFQILYAWFMTKHYSSMTHNSQNIIFQPICNVKIPKIRKQNRGINKLVMLYAENTQNLIHIK